MGKQHLISGISPPVNQVMLLGDYELFSAFLAMAQSKLHNFTVQRKSQNLYTCRFSGVKWNRLWRRAIVDADHCTVCMLFLGSVSALYGILNL